jgi:hypothetical protein
MCTFWSRLYRQGCVALVVDMRQLVTQGLLNGVNRTLPLTVIRGVLGWYCEMIEVLHFYHSQPRILVWAYISRPPAEPYFASLCGRTLAGRSSHHRTSVDHTTYAKPKQKDTYTAHDTYTHVHMYE